MYFVTVTWMDGREAVYPSVPKWNSEGGLLQLSYELEAHIIPLANVRSWKSEAE